jgi:hypothetical protein
MSRRPLKSRMRRLTKKEENFMKRTCIFSWFETLDTNTSRTAPAIVARARACPLGSTNVAG